VPGLRSVCIVSSALLLSCKHGPTAAERELSMVCGGSDRTVARLSSDRSARVSIPFESVVVLTPPSGITIFDCWQADTNAEQPDVLAKSPRPLPTGELVFCPVRSGRATIYNRTPCRSPGYHGGGAMSADVIEALIAEPTE
jgi:hypothetical protein